jgi:divalent metal cation (Fe/Co/Zn/Cd) transporter
MLSMMMILFFSGTLSIFSAVRLLINVGPDAALGVVVAFGWAVIYVWGFYFLSNAGHASTQEVRISLKLVDFL